MAANSISRDRYREYAQYLRLSAGSLNLSIAPGRLQRLRSQVSVERNKFLIWEVVWILIALVTLVPVLMVVAAEFGLPLPASVAIRAEALHFQFVNLENALAVSAVIASAVMFPVAAFIAIMPIAANADALTDLEYAHRALKAVEKQ